LDTTTPMTYNSGHSSKSTEQNVDIESKHRHGSKSSGLTRLHYLSTEPMNPHHGHKSNNNHHDSELKKTTEFDEWKEVTEEINKDTRDIEETTPRRGLATYWRDKFIPKVNHS
jgi:hypothetical protein